MLAAFVVALGIVGVVGGPAAARPYCDRPVPPPGCDDLPDEEPPPPVGSDKSPTGRVESHGYNAGTYRVAGWAEDVNGGPVQIWINVDQTHIGTFTANLWHAGRGAWSGFDITVPAPTSAGSHRIEVTLVNVPDGTQPAAPYSSILNILPWTNLPATPTGLMLAANRGGITVGFTDPSWSEQGFSVTYDWMERVIDRDGHWVTTTEARTVELGASPGGGGRVEQYISGLKPTTFYRFYIRTREAGMVSPPLLGSISTTG